MGFRKDFVWGAATAAFQIEGAAFEDGKGRSVWDESSHREGAVFQNHNGDIACDHYHRYKDDVKMMAEMGLKAYRFSFSWPRIIPDGTGKVNEKGIEFYENLLDELEKYGIEPYATLYHWDLPYALHCKGGWLNDEISDWYAAYVKVIAEKFGGRIKHFITFNEPKVFLGCGYMQGVHAPGHKLPDEELLHMGHNILKSHGKAVRVIRELVPDAKIGLVGASTTRYAVSPEYAKEGAEIYFSCNRNHFVFSESFWFDPVVFGKYPETLLSDCRDIFPAYTKEDMEIISSPIDFIGLNIYTGRPMVPDAQGRLEDMKLPEGHPRNSMGWMILPDAIYWATRMYTERYHLPIYITENGMAAHDVISLDGKVHDPNRIDFLNRYLLALRRSAEEGSDIRGYFHWSFMDNFEWAEGYNERFGLVYVDYESQRRILKDSAYWYTDVIRSNGENL